MYKKTAEDIENRMNVLAGMPLSSYSIAGGMLCLQFGALSRKVAPGKPDSQVGSWALHIQCPWRFELRGMIYVGCDDLWGPDNPPSTANLPEADGAEQCHVQREQMDRLFQNCLESGHLSGQGSSFLVQQVRADNFGGIEIDLSSSLCLALFPATFREECWRFFSPNTQEKHLIVGGRT